MNKSFHGNNSCNGLDPQQKELESEMNGGIEKREKRKGRGKVREKEG